MIAELFSAENLIALLTLTSLEIVLGIDNIVFLAILTANLPAPKDHQARRIGLALALVARIVLLLLIKWIMRLTAPLFTVLHHEFSGRDLILLVGGLFLVAKATLEIHAKLENPEGHHATTKKASSFGMLLLQIVAIDMVFSLDSVITAVGMAKQIWVMIAAVVIAIIVMMIFADGISRFIEKHPTLKMLALSFLLLIGVMLILEGTGKEIERGYIYFAMAFSLFVEILNLRTTRKRHPAHAS